MRGNYNKDSDSFYFACDPDLLLWGLLVMVSALHHINVSFNNYV